MVYVFSNVQRIKDSKKFVDKLCASGMDTERDTFVFINDCIPLLRGIEFFRQCKNIIICLRWHEAAQSWFGLDSVRTFIRSSRFCTSLHIMGIKNDGTTIAIANDAFALAAPEGARPVGQISRSEIVESVGEPYPSNHIPTTGFYVYAALVSARSKDEVCLVNFYGHRDDSTPKCEEHDWAFEDRKLHSPDVRHLHITEIDWAKYFDKIYCLHYLPYKERLPLLQQELKRIDIWQSGIFEMRYTSPTRYDSLLTAEIAGGAPARASIVNITMEYNRLFAEAGILGYRRVLFLEDDETFLKDIAAIEEMLENIPADADIVQFDKNVHSSDGEAFQKWFAQHKEDGLFIKADGIAFHNSGCFMASAKAMAAMHREIERNIVPPDVLFMTIAQRYVARKNLVIQRFSTNSLSSHLYSITSFDGIYKTQGIDYKEYALPEEVADSMPKHKLKISVYAIARNEEKFAKRWYECFKEADEVCVLVNNSTDKTAEILRSLGAKVTEKSYVNFRFDEARNDAMALCAPDADLLFACDLDDTIKPGWREGLEQIWQKALDKGEEPNALLYTYVVCYDENDERKRQPFLIHRIHMPTGWKWKHRVHEVLASTNKVFLYYPELAVESHPEENKDHSRYLPLLEEDAREPDAPARILHMLGREYMNAGKYEEAIEVLKQHLLRQDARWEFERCASMKFIADCYGMLGKPELKEKWLWRAMNENQYDRDSAFVLGRMLLAQKEYNTAVRVLERCLAITERRIDYPSYSYDAWSELAEFCLAEAYFYDGQWAKSEEWAKKGLEKNPNNEMGQQFLKELQQIMSSRPHPVFEHEQRRLIEAAQL